MKHLRARTDLHSVAAPAPITIRRPRVSDGRAIHRLIAGCRPLDPNSLYCNLLQCTHFAQTCALAESRDGIVGFASGYLKPDDPQNLFIWQVAVAPEARGQKLGQRLIRHILAGPACASVRRLSATIGEANRASWAMFEELARELGSATTRSCLFDADACFNGQHESEILFTIGPFGDERLVRHTN